MVILLNFIGKNKYTYDCIIISYSKVAFVCWISKDDNLQNVFEEMFTSPKASDDGYQTVENFQSHYWYHVAKKFCKKEKNPSMDG